jgi:hypothetical protein
MRSVNKLMEGRASPEETPLGRETRPGIDGGRYSRKQALFAWHFWQAMKGDPPGMRP